MAREGYAGLSIPRALWDRLQSLVEDHPELGYRSASEAATDAIRRHCEDLEDRLERGVEPPND